LERDPEHADKSKELLWLMASGGSSHGRKFGFGSKLDHISLPHSDRRARPTQSMASSLSASGLTQQQNQGIYSAEEVAAMMQEKERQFAEECARRDRLEGERNNHNNFLFSQLFAFMGVQMPQFNVSN
jgi:hypothetical protein